MITPSKGTTAQLNVSRVGKGGQQFSPNFPLPAKCEIMYLLRMKTTLLVLVSCLSSAFCAEIKLTGVFDPYECQDKKATNTVVMKAAPKCGECHAWGVIKGNTLDLKVAHGKTTNSWVIAGQLKDGQMIFEKPKFHMTYADGVLKGEYKGKMNARIELKAEK